MMAADLILEISFYIALIGCFILFIVKEFKKDKFTRLTAVGGILVVQAFIIFSAIFYIDSNNYKKARNHFNRLMRRDHLNVNMINYKIYSSQERHLLNLLQNSKDVFGQKSHPLDTINIQIYSPKDTLILMLRKDSKILDQYWIFWPRYSVKNEIGRIQINLDSLLKKN